MASINHTLWIFDRASRETDFKTKEQSLIILNNLFLANCIDDDVTSARAVLTTSGTITPGKYDAVVFLVQDLIHSVAKKAGGNISIAAASSNVLGTTSLGLGGGRRCG